MDRDALREAVLFTLLESGGASTAGMMRSLDGSVSKHEVRGLLMNLRRAGLVEQVDDYGGTTWEPNQSEIQRRIKDSVEDVLETEE